MYSMLKMFVFRWYPYPFLNSEPERTLHDFTHVFWLDGGFNPFEKYCIVLRIKVPFNIFLYYNDDFVDVHPTVERMVPKLTPKQRMAFHNENSYFPIIRITHFGQRIPSYNLHKSTILGRFKFDPLHLMPKPLQESPMKIPKRFTHQVGWKVNHSPHLYHEDVAIPDPNHLPQLLP